MTPAPDALCRHCLLPEAKRAALDQYRARHGAVAMVGDGLNDGPGLAWADVGIAVGSATDLARETADLVLPADGLWLLPWVVGRARAVRVPPSSPTWHGRSATTWWH